MIWSTSFTRCFDVWLISSTIEKERILSGSIRSDNVHRIWSISIPEDSSLVNENAFSSDFSRLEDALETDWGFGVVDGRGTLVIRVFRNANSFSDFGSTVHTLNNSVTSACSVRKYFNCDRVPDWCIRSSALIGFTFKSSLKSWTWKTLRGKKILTCSWAVSVELRHSPSRTALVNADSQTWAPFKWTACNTRATRLSMPLVVSWLIDSVQFISSCELRTWWLGRQCG